MDDVNETILKNNNKLTNVPTKIFIFPTNKGAYYTITRTKYPQTIKEKLLNDIIIK
jgi:hypothetical protein